MAMFPDDFPFSRRVDEVDETEVPTVEAQPLEASAFADDFPFTKRPEAPAEAPGSLTRATFAPVGSSIFPPGFPFAEPVPQPERPVESLAEAVPAVATEIDAAIVQALAPSPGAPRPAPLPVAPLPFKDRRRSPRQRLSAKATLRIDNVGGNPLSVEIDNLSLLGVRLRTDRELLVNDKANIRLEVGPLKWASRLRVINCIRHDAANYTIGCEFVGNELARGRAAA